MNLAKTYIQNTIKELSAQKALGEKTFAQIRDEKLHWQPNETCNSMAVLIQHLHGNMLSRWTNLLTEDGEKAWRKRDEEFEDQHFSREHLLQIWEDGWSVLFNALNQLEQDDLLKEITIRQQKLSVLEAINRQLTHYAYHVGQIVQLGKIIAGKEWENLSVPKRQK